MKIEVTPEDVTELGKQFGNIWLANLTMDDVLARFESREVLSHFKPVDRLAGLEPKEVLSHFRPVERLAGLEPVERLAGLEPKEVLSHFRPVERLAGLEPEVIEEYLKQLKKQPK